MCLLFLYVCCHHVCVCFVFVFFILFIFVLALLDESKLAEMKKEMELLKNRNVKDKEELRIQVLAKSKECKRLNNKLQEAKVCIYK